MTKRAPSPLDSDDRNALLLRERPRSLPLAPTAEPAKRRLPLADAARDIDKRHRPIYCVWEITLACDLSCRHCGSRAGRARPDELTTAECLDVVRQLQELGVLEVTLIGGEAYLRPDFLVVVRALRDAGMQVSITTGGRGITEQLARDAAAAGLLTASVSIDGDEETHDRLRAVKGSYASARESLRHLRAAGIGVSVNSQVNRLSMPLLPHILDLITEHGCHSWQLALTVPMGRAVDEPDVLLQPYDFLELFPLLAELETECRRRDVRLWLGNNLGYYGPHELQLRGRIPRSTDGACSAGRGTLGLEADGAVKGCPSLPTEEWTGGNLRDASLRDIWERAAPLRYTRDRTVNDLWGYCRSCYYAEECKAGCTWTANVVFGRAGNNPYCHHRALEMDRLGVRERIERVTAAPGQPFDHGRFRVVREPVRDGKLPEGLAMIEEAVDDQPPS